MKSLVGGKAEMIEVAGAVTSEHLCLGWKILYRKTMGSNSMETLLSRVKRRTEIKFLMREGEIKTSLRWRGEEVVGMTVHA
jgi:hypothetical protein